MSDLSRRTLIGIGAERTGVRRPQPLLLLRCPYSYINIVLLVQWPNQCTILVHILLTAAGNQERFFRDRGGRVGAVRCGAIELRR